jgi:hypothetical protein
MTDPTLLPRSCPTSERIEQIGVILALSCLSESLVPISTSPVPPHEVGTIFHLDGYQLLAVAGTFADAGLVLGIDRPDKQLQLSIGRTTMDEEALNTSVRRFLKKLGVTAQREIEIAVRDADAKGLLKGSDPLPAKAVVTVGGIDLKFEIDGDIELG